MGSGRAARPRKAPRPLVGAFLHLPLLPLTSAQSEWLYNGTLDCFQKVVREEGITAMFKGAGANALRTVGAALVLVFYSEITRAAGLNLGSGGGE